MTHAQIILLCLVLVPGAAYRLQRIVTADSWPPSRWFRETLRDRVRVAKARTAASGAGNTVADRRARRHLMQRQSRAEYAFKLMTCAWCFGFWVSGAVVLATDLFLRLRSPFRSGLPLPLLWWPLTSAVVGKLGKDDDDDD